MEESTVSAFCERRGLNCYVKMYIMHNYALLLRKPVIE